MHSKKGFSLAVSGLALAVASLFGAFYAGPELIKKLVIENMILSDGSESLERWKVTPQPLAYYTYIFNVENPEEVARGARPVLKEKGPYVYDLYRERVDVKFHPEDDTVSYFDKTIYRFNQNKSGCRSEDDVVTVLNAPVLGTGLMLKRIMEFALPLFNDAMPTILPAGATNAFIKARVREVLFDGVLINCSHPVTDFPVGPVCQGMRSRAPVTFRKEGGNFYFSMFNHLNGTDTKHRVRVVRGQRNPNALGRIVRFGNSSLHTAWRENTPCNMINGTDTTIFHPLIKPPEKLPVFVSGSCRSMYVTFERAVMAHGVRALHYVADPKMLASGGNYRPNRCFCPPAPPLPPSKDDKVGEASAMPPAVTALPATHPATVAAVTAAAEDAVVSHSEGEPTAQAQTLAQTLARTAATEEQQVAEAVVTSPATAAAVSEAGTVSEAMSATATSESEAAARRRRRDMTEEEVRDQHDASTCLPDGALDMSTCFGSPVILTLPHFYLGAKEFSEYAIGLKAEKAIHETFVDIEPLTGAPIRGGKRVQLNMFLQKIDGIDALKDVSEGLFPIVWMDEGIDLEGPTLEQIQSATRRLSMLQVLPWVLLAGSLLMALGGCLVHVHSTGVLQRMVADRDRRARSPPHAQRHDGEGGGPPGNYGIMLGFQDKQVLGASGTGVQDTPKDARLGTQRGSVLLGPLGLIGRASPASTHGGVGHSGKSPLAGLHSLKGLHLHLASTNGVSPWPWNQTDKVVVRTFCSERASNS